MELRSWKKLQGGKIQYNSFVIQSFPMFSDPQFFKTAALVYFSGPEIYSAKFW